MTYKTLWPRGRKASKLIPFAQRVNNLAGKTVGELWDGIFRGDEIFPILEKELLDRYPGVKFAKWTEFPRDGDHGFPDWKAHPDLLAEKGCSAIIVATGA